MTDDGTHAEHDHVVTSTTIGDCDEALQELYLYLDGELTDETAHDHHGTTSTTASRASRPSTSRPSCGMVITKPLRRRGARVAASAASPSDWRRRRRGASRRRGSRPQSERADAARGDPAADLGYGSGRLVYDAVMALADVWHFWIAAVRWSSRRRRAGGQVVGVMYVKKVVAAPVPAPRTERWPGAVDWALAERVAVRVAGREPFAESYHYDSLDAGLRRAHRAGRGAGRGRAPGCGRWPARPGPASTDRAGLGRGPTSRRSSGCCARSSTSSSSWPRASPLSPLAQQGRRGRGGHDARLDVDPGARPVRPAGHRGRGPRRPGPRLLRRPQRPGPREAVRLPAPRVPPVAGAARGHPPGPVHRRAVDARALPRPGRADRSTPSTPTRSGSSTRSAASPRPSAPATTRSTTAAIMALLASPEQRAVLDQVGGLMSLLEGHGDVTMDRAGAGLIPSAERFGRVLRQRRQNASGPGQAAPAAHRPRGQAQPVRAGRAFIEAVENVGRPRAARPGRGAAREPADASPRSADPDARGSPGSAPLTRAPDR